MRPQTIATALAALSFLALSACSSVATTPKPCQLTSDCPTGQFCDSLKQCATPLSHGSGTPPSSNAASSTSGGAAGTAATGASSTGGQNGTTAGPTANSSTGGVAASSTSGGITSTGNGGSTGGGACSCSSSCCSQIAGSGITCPNGHYCYGVTADGGQPFYCNDQSGKCDPFDPCNGNSGVYTCNGNGSASATGGANAGATGGSSGGTTGTIGIQPGGLSFAVIGDTRPPSPCTDVNNCPYPTQVITQIYQDIQALSPVPPYVLTTGDLMDNVPDVGGTASWQLQQYQSAIMAFTGLTFPAMGNHECTGLPSSQCGPTGPDGTGENYTAFLGLLSALNLPNNGAAYYQEGPFTFNGSQTVKFLMLAPNAWDSTQSAWFDTALSQATTYTFVVRHEPDDAIEPSGWAGIAESNAVMANHPGAVTMRLEGHTHELRWSPFSAVDGGSGEAIVGNGGAQPWDCPSGGTTTIYCDYGYLLCQQRTDNSLVCTPYAANGNVPAVAPVPFGVFPNGAEDYPL